MSSILKRIDALIFNSITNNKSPDYIYLGKEDYKEFAEAIDGILQYPAVSDYTMHSGQYRGICVIRVNADRHLNVG